METDRQPFWVSKVDTVTFNLLNLMFNVSLISNGARTLPFWDRVAADLDMVVLTYHQASVDHAHFLQVAQKLSARMPVNVNVTMDPELFDETYAAAQHIVSTFLERCPGATNDDCIIDPGIAPIGSDSEGNIHRLIAAMEMIHADDTFAGVHASVGLSNFTVMLPPKRADGSPVKGPLESAFLTKAMPLGLDTIIGSVVRKYALLPPDHPAMVCLEDFLRLDPLEAIMRVKDFYA